MFPSAQINSSGINQEVCWGSFTVKRAVKRDMSNISSCPGEAIFPYELECPFWSGIASMLSPFHFPFPLFIKVLLGNVVFVGTACRARTPYSVPVPVSILQYRQSMFSSWCSLCLRHDRKQNKTISQQSAVCAQVGWTGLSGANASNCCPAFRTGNHRLLPFPRFRDARPRYLPTIP